MDVELRHLRAFVAVSEAGTFTAAAKRLLITQPALTRTIQQLERILDVKLIERTSRSVALTQTGRAFRDRAQTLLRDLDLATAEARGKRDLRIGFSWALPDPWVSEVIAAFEEATGAATRLMRRDDITAALEHNDIDIALSRHPVAEAHTTSLTLFEEPRVAAVSSRSPLAEYESIEWNELSQHRIVINTTSGNTRPDLWDQEHRPKKVIECDNYDEWITLIAADKGVGATPRSASFTYGHTGVVFVPLVDAPPVPLYLVWIKHGADAFVRQFIEVATTQRQTALTDS
jgi:DNA-binding transcriptional LysR family regulator